MGSRIIRVSDALYDKVLHYKQKLIDKGYPKNISIQETMDVMNTLGEINLPEKEEATKQIECYKKIKRVNNSNNHITKRRTHRIIMEIGLPRIYKDKRGSNADILLLVLTVFGLIIGGIVLKDIWDSLYDDSLSTGGIFNQSSVGSNVGKGVDAAFNGLDYMAPMILFLGFGVVVVLVFQNPIPPAFWFIGGLFSVILGWISIFFREIYIDMLASNGSLNNLVSEFPITNHLIMNLWVYIAVMFFIMATIQYGRSRSSATIT